MRKSKVQNQPAVVANPEEIKKLEFANKMRVVMNNPEVKAKVVEKTKEYWANNPNPNKGKTFSDLAKTNMAIGQKLKKAFDAKDKVLAQDLINQLKANGYKASAEILSSKKNRLFSKLNLKEIMKDVYKNRIDIVIKSDGDIID